MKHLPTTKQLQYLASLYEYRHFGRAAAACFVSQPAFSIAIRELEGLLNMQVVDRTNRKVTFTATGKEIAIQAKLVLQDLGAIVDSAGHSGNPLSGSLRLGAIPTIAPFLFPELLPKVRRNYPDLKLYLEEGMTNDIHASLMQGDLDLLLVALPFPLRNTETMKLFQDRFYLACRKGSKLLDSGNPSTEQLPAASILLLQDGHCLRDHALTACRIRNLGRISPVSASSLLTLVQMVDADLGVTYLPEMALQSHLMKNTRLEIVPLAKGASREIALAWRRGSARKEEFRMLGEFIRGLV